MRNRAKSHARIPNYKIISRAGLHYVFGFVGDGKYMQMGEGLASREAASDLMRRHRGCEASAKANLAAWDFSNGDH